MRSGRWPFWGHEKSSDNRRVENPPFWDKLQLEAVAQILRELDVPPDPVVNIELMVDLILAGNSETEDAQIQDHDGAHDNGDTEYVHGLDDRRKAGDIAQCPQRAVLQKTSCN